MDVEGISPGDNFVGAIRGEIERSTLLLAIIGKDWCIAAGEDGAFRLDQREDLVRREVLTAFNNGVRIVPVLVNGATMPKENDLPAALRLLIKLNAISIQDDSFEEGMKRLLDVARLSAIISERRESERQPLPKPQSQVTMPKQKVCLLGAAGVGKTSLVSRYVHNMFKQSYISSVGVAISKKLLRIGEIELNLVIWDMAGEEEGSPIKINQIRDARGLILVADGCNAASLETAIDIRQRCLTEVPSATAVLIVNKVDLLEEWQVDIKSLRAFEPSGLVTFTTSAKTGKGVEDMFRHIARTMLIEWENSGSDDDD
jgi:small GTP-binding protein